MNPAKWLAGKMGLNWSGGFESARYATRRRADVPVTSLRDMREDLSASTRSQMLKASRYVARTSGFHREVRKTTAIYSVGCGLKPQSMAETEEAQNLYEQRWQEWGRRCELTNRFDIVAVQHQVCEALDIDGEIFAIKTKDRFNQPKLQILESHRISCLTDPSRRIWDGIQLDAVGRPRFYHLVNQGEGPTSPNTTPIPAHSVIHVFEPESPSAVRGVPGLQHGLNGLRDEGELLSFETHATKQNSELGIVVKSNRGEALADGDFGYDVEGSSPPTSETAIASALGGRAIRIDETEEVQSFASNRPNSMFDGFLELLEREAAGGNLPYEVTRDASKVGGASVRLVTSKADRYFQHRQQILINRFLLPAWGYVMGWQIDQLGDPAVPGWNKVRFQTPRKISVDAGREAQQSRLDVESGLGLISEHIGERGGDFDQWLKSRQSEARKIMTAAGFAESEPIPLWMLYKPQGAGIDMSRQGTPEEGEAIAAGLNFETLKNKFDAYGVGVRAGSITPQTDDEDSFRKEAKLPPMSADAKKAWEQDLGVRRPITLQSQSAFAQEQEDIAEDEDDTEQEE